MKIKLSLLALIFCLKFNFAQEIQLKIETEESSIKYKGDHLLHSWEGINNNVNGIAILNPKSNKIEKIAILIYVLGLIFAALVLDLWSSETGPIAFIGIIWTVILLIALFYCDKYEASGDDLPLVDTDGTAHGTKFGYKDAMYVSVIQQLITRLEAAEAKIAVLEG